MMHYFGLMLSILFIAATTYSSLGRIARQKDNLLAIDRQLVELRRSELRDQRGVHCGFGLTSNKGTDVDFSSHGHQAVETAASQADRLMAVATQYENWRCPTNALVDSRGRLETMRADELRQISAAMIRQLSCAVALVMCVLACGLYAFLNRSGFNQVLGT